VRQKLKRMTIVMALIFMAVIAAGCGENGAGQVEAPKLPVELAPVSRQDIAQSARVIGTVKAGTTAQVMAAMAGKLEAVLVNVGDKVTLGQVIAQLESSQLKAGLAQAEAGLEQAKVKAALDEENFQRTQVLFDQGAASQQVLDAARTTLEASRAQVAAAEAAVRQAEIALDNSYIKAPISGEVAARLLEPGTVAQGPIVTLVSTGNLQVEIGVTERDVNYLQPGQEVVVAVPAAVAEPLRSRVKNIGPAADDRTRMFIVKIELIDAPEEIKPGMAATVTYTTKQAHDAITVPKAAVVNRGGQNLVFTVVDGRAVGRVVTTGIDDGQRIEITAGLTDGEKIIVKGQDFVNEGQAVEVVNRGPES